jgi:outer membrane protein
MNLKALKLPEELKDGFLEMIAKREAQQAMNHAVETLTNAVSIVALANAENPPALIKLAVQKIDANTDRFSKDEDNEKMMREMLIDVANAIEKIVTNPVAKTGNGQALTEALKADNDLKAMQEEMQRKYEDYEKNKSTMNETKRKETEDSLSQMYQKIQQSAQDNQQALGKLQQDKIGPITNKLVEAIKAVGKAGGYVYIMDTTSGIPYISETLSKDVTAEVKAELNKTK